MWKDATLGNGQERFASSGMDVIVEFDDETNSYWPSQRAHDSGLEQELRDPILLLKIWTYREQKIPIGLGTEPNKTLYSTILSKPINQ